MNKTLMIAGAALACVAAPAMAGGSGACGGCTASGGGTTTTTSGGGGTTTTSGGGGTATGGGGGGGGGANLVVNPGFVSTIIGGTSAIPPWNIGHYGLFKSTGFNGNTVFTSCRDPSCLLPDNIVPGPPWTSFSLTDPYLIQGIATTAGKRYDISFQVAEDTGPKSEFVVFWDGQQIADVVNPANNTIPYAFVTNQQPDAKDFVKFSYPGLLATTSSTTLEVKGYDEAGEIFFGNFKVTLSPVQ